MPTYVMRNGEFVPKELAEPLYLGKMSGHKAPLIITDSMEPTRHMATGRYHTSKAAFRADTKASGCIEYGNDPALLRPRKRIPLDRKKRREDIKRTIYELRNGKRS